MKHGPGNPQVLIHYMVKGPNGTEQVVTRVPTSEGAWAWLRVLRTGVIGNDAEMRRWAREERAAWRPAFPGARSDGPPPPTKPRRGKRKGLRLV